MALVVPLLLAYEALLLWLDPPVRNSAELAFSRFVALLPAHLLPVLRLGTLCVLLLVSLAWLLRERAAAARPWLVFAEALALALLLGPGLGLLVGGLGLSAHAPPPEGHAPWLPFLLSVGAGLWEEIVFRLGLLGGLVVVLRRLVRLQPLPAHVLAIVVSALAFALYHHVGHAGEPLLPARFVFRALAGTILGVLFVYRGFAVVVYMHVFYDVLCDLRALAP